MTKIGFIGQGWIGKHYADDFEARLYEVVRYALEEPYVQNKDLITECDIVFIAVPTPTTPDGYSYEIVADALTSIRAGATAVIKSTLAPGTTEKLQEQFSDLFVLHSPEFLREAMAAHDASHPDRNIVGIPVGSPEYQSKAQEVLNILPDAPYIKIMSAREAELVKYAGNCFLMTKVLFMNILYDLVQVKGDSWDKVKDALVNDPRIGDSHTEVIHASGHMDTKETNILRGAGGHCFIKDFEAFRLMYKTEVSDVYGDEVLRALVAMNNNLLLSSNKDVDLLQGVYGDNITLKD